ncbi:MAG TPA: chromate efflux transporter [Candidatus Dormibacteraeota bacterium]|nr:chromate efflux transporter [Candidatus Dormibacteraeota bacterium]
MEDGRGSRLAEVAAVFGRLGWTAFGGPASHVALMEREVVRRRHWLDESRFGELFAACNLVPGPASTQLALLIGKLRAGWAGMALAALLFIGPAVLCMLALGELYLHLAGRRQIAAALLGVDAAVVAILVRAILDLSRLGLRRWQTALIGAAGCAASLLGASPIPILAAAGGAGVLLIEPGAVTRVFGTAGAPRGRVRGLLLAAAPSGGAGTLLPLALAFLKIGALAFGSGYVLLPLLHAELVGGRFGLTDHQIADAFGVAQATPGPVFATAAFLGVQVAGIPGGVVAALAVFAPSAVYVQVAGAVAAAVPSRPAARAALHGVLAAAVGLIAAAAVTLARTALAGAAEVVGAALALLLLLVRPTAQPLAILTGAAAGLASTVLAP